MMMTDEPKHLRQFVARPDLIWLRPPSSSRRFVASNCFVARPIAAVGPPFGVMHFSKMTQQLILIESDNTTIK